MIRLPILLVSCLLFASAHAQEAHAQRAGPSNLPDLRITALAAVNADRTGNGLPTLERSDRLDRIAQDHARDMLARGYFAHETPEGMSVRDRFLAAGGSESLLVGENIAKCTGCPPPDTGRVRALQAGWMNSPGHRRNILTDGFERFGFGIAHDGGRQYAVQTFAGAGAEGGRTLAAGEILDVMAELVNARRDTRLEPAPELATLLRERAGIDTMPDLGSIMGAVDGYGRVALLSASCGGCGTAITQDDLEDFVERWSTNRADALRGDFTHLAAAAFADGAGRNRAFLLLAKAR